MSRDLDPGVSLLSAIPCSCKYGYKKPPEMKDGPSDSIYPLSSPTPAQRSWFPHPVMLALALTLFLAPPALSSSSLFARWSDTDQYHGKTLTPSNYTVITGIFAQDDPKTNATGYSLLNDSFGLIDKSENRWTNLTTWVFCPPHGAWASLSDRANRSGVDVDL